MRLSCVSLLPSQPHQPPNLPPLIRSWMCKGVHLRFWEPQALTSLFPLTIADLAPQQFKWEMSQGAKHIQPEAATVAEPSPHCQMVWCSNSLLELITRPPEGQLHSGTISHFPAKCVFFPHYFLAALFQVAVRSAHEGKRDVSCSLHLSLLLASDSAAFNLEIMVTCMCILRVYHCCI